MRKTFTKVWLSWGARLLIVFAFAVFGFLLPSQARISPAFAQDGAFRFSQLTPFPDGFGATLVSCASISFCGVSGGTGFGKWDFSAGQKSDGEWNWSSPIPDGPLSDLTCPSSNLCVGVSDGKGGRLFWTFNESAGRWTAAMSSPLPLVPTNQPDTSGTVFMNGVNQINGVSCASTSLCVAVGSDNTQPDFSTYTQSDGAWDWSPPAAVAPDSSGGGALSSVSCPSATLCVAVGGDSNNQQIYATYSATNGSWTWSPVEVVAPDSSGAGYFSHVSCPRATMCVAVGEDPNSWTIYSTGTESGGVWTWTAPSPLTTLSTNAGGEEDVSCADTSPTFCVVVGDTLTGTGNTTPLFSFAGTESGGAWKWTEMPPVFDYYGSKTAFASVSCPSAALCLGVAGDYAIASYQPSPPTVFPVEVTFANGSASLSSKDQAVLLALDKRLVRGATVRMTSAALNDLKLAEDRALAIETFLKSHRTTPITTKAASLTDGTSNTIEIFTLFN